VQCQNHPEAAAVDRCAGFAEPFCPDCLVAIHGQTYCGSCKMMALRGNVPVLDEATVPCKEAGEALTLAFVSLFCFGFIIGPLAVSKALKARKLIEENPRLSGWGKSNAAVLVGIIAFATSVLFLISRATATNHR
jgi:hypothetical protein